MCLCLSLCVCLCVYVLVSFFWLWWQTKASGFCIAIAFACRCSLVFVPLYCIAFVPLSKISCPCFIGSLCLLLICYTNVTTSSCGYWVLSLYSYFSVHFILFLFLSIHFLGNLAFFDRKKTKQNKKPAELSREIVLNRSISLGRIGVCFVKPQSIKEHSFLTLPWFCSHTYIELRI